MVKLQRKKPIVDLECGPAQPQLVFQKLLVRLICDFLHLNLFSKMLLLTKLKSNLEI